MERKESRRQVSRLLYNGEGLLSSVGHVYRVACRIYLLNFNRWLYSSCMKCEICAVNNTSCPNQRNAGAVCLPSPLVIKSGAHACQNVPGTFQRKEVVFSSEEYRLFLIGLQNTLQRLPITLQSYPRAYLPMWLLHCCVVSYERARGNADRSGTDGSGIFSWHCHVLLNHQDANQTR